MRHLAACSLASFVVALSACGPQGVSQTTDPAGAALSEVANARVAQLRARFGHAALPDGAVVGYEQLAGGRVHPIAPPIDAGLLAKPVRVELPAKAGEEVLLEDERSHLSVRFAQVNVPSASLELARGGLAVYGDVVHRVHAEGTEDYVRFAEKPAREELVYRVDVRRVAGMRLVDRTLEFLDREGTPRLRVAAPYVLDADAQRHEANLEVEGCAFDTSVVVPWGRAVTAPGADACTVRVTWRDVQYPALVDPAWVSTGSLLYSRSNHTATRLLAGNVLLVGGSSTTATEIYNEASGTFAAAGSMSTNRSGQTATLMSTGKVLIAGGETNGSISTILSSYDVYNPATGWSSGSMKSARKGHAAALLGNGKVLIAGGRPTSGSGTSTAELFDGTTSTLTTALPELRAYHGMVPLSNGKVLIVGGSLGYPGTMTATALVSDGVTHTSVGSMGVARTLSNGMAVALPNGKVLIVGGGTAQSEWFDGVSSFSNVGAALPALNVTAGDALKSGKALVFALNGPSTYFQLFDGISKFSTESKPSSASANSGSTLTTLASGKILLAGGATSTSAAIYQLPSGDACTSAADCGSGVCDGGFCCSAACGTCQTCAKGTGACVTVTSADDVGTCSGTNTCGPTGTCGLRNGQAATSGASCASGNAADGVCCDTACAGACDSCAVAGKIGTCTTTPATAGSPSCSPYLCQSGAACPTSCTSDANCVTGTFCSSAGTCTTRRAIGAACPTGNHECSNNQCVDGVCCSTACASNCMACSAAKSGVPGSDGTCTYVTSGAVGRGECGAPTCVASTLTTPTCNGSGSCTTGTKSCLPSSCNTAGNACQTTCTKDADCGSGFYCAGTSCAAKKASGKTCTVANECVSGSCVDGVCCSSTCAGPCEACNETGKAGTCSAVSGTPRTAHPACNGAGTTCAGTCDGVNTAFCSYPNVGKLCDAGCSGSAIARCSASGSCLAPTACPGNFGCADLTSCLSTCSADAQCASGFYCASGACKSKLANGYRCAADNECKNAHCVAGTCCASSCTGYACESTGAACKSTCASDADCDAASYCVAGACTPRKGNGETCTTKAECSSGYCADGVCCNSACSGNCEACTAAKTGIAGSTGTCNFVKDGADPDFDCGMPTCSMGTLTANVCNGAGVCRASTTSCGAYGCNAAGDGCKTACTTDAECGAGSYCNTTTKECAAKKPRAAACAANLECTSGACADGVCCDSACTGQCEACAEPGSEGTCLTVKGKPRAPRVACTGGGTECGGTCDGKNAAVCSFPNLETTCGAGCAAGAIAQCDGAGACRAPKTCAGDFACDGSAACKTSCTAGGDCRDGYTCDTKTNKCVPKVQASCSSDRTKSIPADAPDAPKSCAPYVCGTDGTCLQTCATSEDCASSSICDTSTGAGRCVAGPTDEDSGGCTVASTGRESSTAMLAVFALIAAAKDGA